MDCQDRSNDLLNFALVDYFFPLSDAECASKTILDINVAIAGVTESPLSSDVVLNSGMSHDAWQCPFSSRFCYQCRHIVAVSFHVCTLSASGRPLLGRMEMQTLPD